MHRIAALFVVMLLVLSGGGNFADPAPVTPAPLLPLPGTPQPPDPLSGFRGLQPTPAAVTPAAPNTSRLPDITYVEDFAEPIVDLFGEEVVPHTAPFGQQAFLLTTQRAIHMPYSYVEEVHLRAQIRVEAGSAYFTLRESGAGAYVVRLDSAGQVTLTKSGAPLASAQVSGPEWFSTGTDLSIHISGAVVTVAVGTSRLIEYADPTPLPYGVLTFGALGPDSVRVWISSLSLEARTASDLDAGARVIEAAIVQRESRMTVVGLPQNTVDRVYFHRDNLEGGWIVRSIYSSPADPTGDEAVQVVHKAREGAISPDGTRLAYVSNRDGAWRLWVKNTDGTIQRLTPRALGPELQTYQGADRTPSWSPNGREITFIRDDQNLAYDQRDHLYVIDVDTRQIKEYVLPGPTANNSRVYEPALDGDSRYLIFVVGDSIVNRREIVRIDRHEQAAEYTMQTLVTRYQLHEFELPMYPEVSRDGKLLAFLGGSLGRLYVRVLSESTGPTTPTPTPSPTPTGTPTPPPVNLFSFPLGVNISAFDLAWHPDSKLADPSSLFLALAVSPSPLSSHEIWYAQPDFSTGTLIWAEDDAGQPPEKISVEEVIEPVSWAGTTDFATSRIKCVSVVAPNGLIARSGIFPIQTNAPIYATFVAPNRVHAVGQAAMADGVWVEIDGYIPDFASDRTPTPYPTAGASPWTHYWVRAADLSVDLCDDSPQINDPEQGFVNRVQYLPVVDFLTPTPLPTQTPTPPPSWVVSCDLNASLRVRTAPTLAESAIVPDALFARGEAVPYTGPDQLWTNGIPPGDWGYWGIVFGQISYQGQTRWVAKQNITSISTFDYLVQGQPGCATNPDQYDGVDPFKVGRREYYSLYEGAVFWAIYAETREGRYEEDYAAVDLHAGANAMLPHPTFYTENPLMEPEKLPRYALSLMPPHQELDRRDYRYLIARLLLANVPEFTNDAFLQNGDTPLYDTGFNYFTRFGSSIGDPSATEYWMAYVSQVCFSANPIVLGGIRLIEYSAVYNLDSQLEPGNFRLEWLKRYAACRATLDDQLSSAYAIIMPYVRLAIEDQIFLRPNPMYPAGPIVPTADRGRGQVKTINRCYLHPETCAGQLVDVGVVCNLENSNCRNARYFNPQGTPGPALDANSVPVTVENWRQGLVVTSPLDNLNYPNCNTAQTRHLFPPNAVLKQLVYITEIGKPGGSGCTYSVTVGEYDSNGNTTSSADNQYFLMGLGREPVSNDSLLGALNRHWARLDYANPTGGQSYSPSDCMVGFSHVIDKHAYKDGRRWFWTTLTYQVNDNYAPDSRWFCDIAG